MLRQLLISTALIAFSTLAAYGQQARYASWGFDEYEFFGLTKPQLAAKFKSKLIFKEDYKRIIIAPQNGNCMGYDGPTFELTYQNDKVAKVQRIFAGCKETQYGPVLDSKKAALKYFLDSMDDIVKSGGALRADEQVKVKTAKTELAAITAKH